MKFGAIIVTYNRLSLLKECLECVFSQTVPFHRVLVVDNHSTDGTGEYLDSLENPALSVLHLPENIGGAGGFSKGLEVLSAGDCDWVLIIDDDAMIAPTYMEEIGKAIGSHSYLAYSGTVRTAGAIDTSHRRILKNRCLMTYAPVPEETYRDETFLYDVSTFCGLVLNCGLIREIGLPRADYFIWFDDTEYCLRFRKPHCHRLRSPAHRQPQGGTALPQADLSGRVGRNRQTAGGHGPALSAGIGIFINGRDDPIISIKTVFSTKTVFP